MLFKLIYRSGFFQRNEKREKNNVQLSSLTIPSVSRAFHSTFYHPKLLHRLTCRQLYHVGPRLCLTLDGRQILTFNTGRCANCRTNRTIQVLIRNSISNTTIRMSSRIYTWFSSHSSVMVLSSRHICQPRSDSRLSSTHSKTPWCSWAHFLVVTKREFLNLVQDLSWSDCRLRKAPYWCPR